MPEFGGFEGPALRLAALRKDAQQLRLMTSDPDLRWDLIHAETVAELVIERQALLSPLVLQSNVDYLSNLIVAIRERVAR